MIECKRLQSRCRNIVAPTGYTRIVYYILLNGLLEKRRLLRLMKKIILICPVPEYTFSYTIYSIKCKYLLIVVVVLKKIYIIFLFVQRVRLHSFLLYKTTVAFPRFILIYLIVNVLARSALLSTYLREKHREDQLVPVRY